MNYTLTPGDDPSSPNSTGVQVYHATNNITSSRTIIGGIGTDVTYRAGNMVTLSPGFDVSKHSVFLEQPGDCPN